MQDFRLGLMSLLILIPTIIIFTTVIITAPAAATRLTLMTRIRAGFGRVAGSYHGASQPSQPSQPSQRRPGPLAHPAPSLGMQISKLPTPPLALFGLPPLAARAMSRCQCRFLAQFHPPAPACVPLCGAALVVIIIIIICPRCLCPPSRSGCLPSTPTPAPAARASSMELILIPT